MFCSSETANSMASLGFSKESLSLSSRNVSLVNTRTNERGFMADTRPSSFSESIKRTTKPPMLMRRCRFTIIELMNLNTQNLCFTNKEIITNLDLAELGLRVSVVEKGFVDSKVSRKRSIDDAYELCCERKRKRKKTSEKTNPNPLSDDCLAPKKSNTALANKVAESTSLSKISQPKVSSISSTVDSNLRAAMIKCRFADTILKAQEKMILSQGDKVEKEKLERRKAEVEMKIKNAQCKLKEQRQKEREDARIALEKMERTVEWNHALDLAQEFEKLIGAK